MAASAPPALRVAGLRTEYKENPLGIDVRKPRLSWQLRSDARGSRQTAYEVRVAPTEAALRSGRDLVWSSGRVASEESTQRAYEGPALRSGQRCYWAVRVWDGAGQASAWSRPAWWEMGLIEPFRRAQRQADGMDGESVVGSQFFDGQQRRRIGSAFGWASEHEDVGGGLLPGVGQAGEVEADAPQVAVDRDAVVGRLVDGDAAVPGVAQLVGQVLEVPLAHRGEHAQARVLRRDGGLHAHLVVALARSAVGDGGAAFLVSHAH